MIAALFVIFSAHSWIVAPSLAVLLGSGLLLRSLFLLAGRRTATAPVSRLDRVSPGLIEVQGTAIGPYTIHAPVTGTPCYLYRTAVWQRGKSRLHSWEKLVEETLHVPFFLEDLTGLLLMEPMGADLNVPIKFREEYSASALFAANAVPPAVSLFLARHEVAPTASILVEEFCIEPQCNLFVTGTVTENPGVVVKPLFPAQDGDKEAGRSSDQPAESPEVIRLSASTSLPSGAMTQQSRIAAALTKAGIHNPNAWEAAGVPYPRATSSTTVALQEETGSPADDMPPEDSEAEKGFDLKPNFVLMKGPDNAPFIFSSRRVQSPAPSSVSESLFLLSAGSALTLASLWVFLRRLL